MYNMTTENIFEGAEIIYTYTREMALDDGYLVDVTEAARETGFRYPVALTRAAWENCCEWQAADIARKQNGTCQDERGRLHDVLWMAFLAVRRARVECRSDTVIYFDLYRVPREGRGFKARRTTLKAVCGPGDNAEPVITIMLPGED